MKHAWSFLLLAACGTPETPVVSAVAPVPKADPLEASAPIEDASTVVDAATADVVVDPPKDAGREAGRVRPPGVPPGTMLESPYGPEACTKDADCIVTDEETGCCPCTVDPYPRSIAKMKAERAKCNPRACSGLGSCNRARMNERPESYRAACRDKACVAIKK